MKRTLLALLVLFAATPAAAVVQNGTSPSNDPGEGQMGITATGGHSSQSFRSDGGPQYHLTLAPVNTTPELLGNNVTDVYRGARAVELTGSMQVPTPCHSLATSNEAVGDNTLRLTVTAEPGEGACAQQVVTKRYRLDVQADEAFRLELVHGNETVRTIATEGYPPEAEEEKGVVATLLQFLDSLF